MRRKDRFAALTVKQVTAANDTYLGGITTILSGTTAISVSAVGVNSGDCIMVTPYQYAGSLTNSQAFKCLMVNSVFTGGFVATAVGGSALQEMPVAWMVIRR